MWDMPLGRWGERLAARHLRRAGYRILARGFRCPMGEIDVIAQREQQIVFVEVKTRSSTTHGQPWEAVDARKQRKIVKTAVFFLKRRALVDVAVQFDVIAITRAPGWFSKASLEHFEGAFDAGPIWSI